MLPNPSHLEAVNPVHQGVVYALQSFKKERTLAIQIHGDAAFNGQGVVQETLQMSNLTGFSIGGTIHIIANNQLGYTATANSGRSARYASAPAKMIGAPIIHVNGDAPEQVARAAMLAIQYQERWGKDIVIDMVCYRRHGHNELDEPNFTQPTMYKVINNRKTLPVAYAEKLAESNIMSLENAEEIRKGAFESLDMALKQSETFKPTKFGLQKDLDLGKNDVMGTGFPRKKLEEAIAGSVSLPLDFVSYDAA